LVRGIGYHGKTHVTKLNDIQPLFPGAHHPHSLGHLLVLPLHSLCLHLNQTPNQLDLNLRRLLLNTTILAHAAIEIVKVVAVSRGWKT
jgi:hypothetical protein